MPPPSTGSGASRPAGPDWARGRPQSHRMNRCPAGGASTQVTGSHRAPANPGSSRAASLTTAGSVMTLPAPSTTAGAVRAGPRVTAAGAARPDSRRSPGHPGQLTGAGHRVDGGPEPGRVRVGVNLRGGDQGVPEQLLSLVDRPGVQDVGGERVPHLMRRRCMLRRPAGTQQ